MDELIKEKRKEKENYKKPIEINSIEIRSLILSSIFTP